MARLKGPIEFTGSIGNIRCYFNKKLNRYILSTKGGTSGAIIKNNPNFARQRENMNEFKGINLWAKQLRISLNQIKEMREGYYFSHFVSLAKRIQLQDDGHPKGYRSILSSKNAWLLKSLEFNSLYPFDKVFSHPCEVSMSEDKMTITLKLLDFKSRTRINWPESFVSFRIALAIVQLPDFEWSEEDVNFMPVIRDMEKLSVTAFTEWRNWSTDVVDIILNASFAKPALQQSGTSVVVAMGLEVSPHLAEKLSIGQSGIGTMKIVECFV